MAISEKVRQSLIKAGVKNLRVFGYSTVNEDNILVDPIFAAFFKKMLEDNLGQGGGAIVDDTIHELILQAKRTVVSSKK